MLRLGVRLLCMTGDVKIILEDGDIVSDDEGRLFRLVALDAKESAAVHGFVRIAEQGVADAMFTSVFQDLLQEDPIPDDEQLNAMMRTSVRVAPAANDEDDDEA